MILAALTLAVLAADVAPRRPPPAECRADADCVISTFVSCCGACCPREPYAVSRERDNASQSMCSVTDCSAPRCPEVKCAKPTPVSALKAVCQQSRCVAVRIDGDKSECATDGDCRVEERPPPGGCGECGCCPGFNAVAVSNRAARPPPEPSPPRPLAKDPKPTPPFGLSSKGSAGLPPRQAPNCSPCPNPPVSRAVCTAGRCALVKSPGDE